MALTPHSAKVEEAKKVAAKKIAAKEAEAQQDEKESEKEKKMYHSLELVIITGAILAADKTTLQNIPAAVFKAKRVLDEINRD